ncbi:MAG: hypothetical protein OEZ65_14505 [Gemmatimonadota bacterium]|nr:hypothetical protein [Gemmatimonadota bacterium]MDH5760796.1 hypothetical protein [Gemmatimonadota bacterium]
MRYPLVLLAALALLGNVSAGAQVLIDADPGSSIRSREDLVRLLAMYEEALESPAYSSRTKESVRSGALRIRERLELGDFQVGDRVVLSVEGEELPDTVLVETGPAIHLPRFGEISLAGVLRSEITGHLTQVLGRFIRDPVVRAEGLMRLSIQGDVRAPGFFVVPADMLVTDALMVAGGPGPNANLEGLRIERGTERIFEGEELQEAMRLGRTLDQLNLRAGDQLMMPARRAGIGGTVARYALIIGSAVIFGVRIF